MILSDTTLARRLDAGDLRVEPLAPDALGPASIDVRIGSRLLVYRHPVMHRQTVEADWREMLLNGVHAWRLEPGHAYLATTLEWISVPTDLACQIAGRSTVARMFISPHEQAGWLDPGYQGRPTLEMTVTLPVEIGPFEPIAQLVFMQLDQPCERPYTGRYQADHEPTPARWRMA